MTIQMKSSWEEEQFPITPQYNIQERSLNRICCINLLGAAEAMAQLYNACISHYHSAGKILCTWSTDIEYKSDVGFTAIK